MLICLGSLINRCHQEIGSIEELILRSLTQCVGIGILQKHSPYHRQAIHRFFGNAVSIRHDLWFQFQIPSIDRSDRFAQSMRILFIGSPPVHIQLHGREGFPLEVSGIDYRILSSEDTVHIRTDIRITRQTWTYISRNVETNIFPDSSCLVARPYTGIALRTRPAIKGNNKGTGIITIVSHNLCHVCDTIQSKGISGTYPGNIGFQYTHACIPHFLYNVTLQQSTDTFFGMKIGLCP